MGLLALMLLIAMDTPKKESHWQSLPEQWENVNGEKGKMSKNQMKQRKKTMGRSVETLPYLREGHMRDSDERAQLL